MPRLSPKLGNLDDDIMNKFCLALGVLLIETIKKIWTTCQKIQVVQIRHSSLTLVVWVRG